MPLGVGIAEAVLRFLVFAQGFAIIGAQRGIDIVAGKKVALVQPDGGHVVVAVGGEAGPHGAGAAAEVGALRLAGGVLADSERRVPLACIHSAGKDDGVAEAAVFPGQGKAAGDVGQDGVHLIVLDWLRVSRLGSNQFRRAIKIDVRELDATKAAFVLAPRCPQAGRGMKGEAAVAAG